MLIIVSCSEDTIYWNLLSRKKVWICISWYTDSPKHGSTLFHTYIPTEQIFDSRSFMYNKIFLKKPLKKLVANTFTLLLVSFASKLVNFWRPSEYEKSLKTVKSLCLRENGVDFEFFWKFKISLCLKLLNNLDTICSKRSVKMWAINFYKTFQKYFVVHERSAVINSFSML